MKDDLINGFLLIVIGIIIILWLVIKKPTYPIRNYFIGLWLSSITCILFGLYFIIEAFIKN